MTIGICPTNAFLLLEVAAEGKDVPAPGLGFAYGKLEQRTQAQAVLDELRQRAKTQYVSRMVFALVHIGRSSIL
jgi:hypothetical protein